MALKVNCDGFQRDRYFARSWALITQDQGWIKPVLLLTLAQLVPILGPLGVSGYVVEWARLLAWNVNAAPKQRGVNIGSCISSGWRTFVVYLGWGCLIFFALIILGVVPLIGGLLAFAGTIFCFYLEQLLRVAALRASIYQKLGAGYNGARIWEMGARDVEGLLRILGIDLVGNLIIGLIFAIVGTIVVVAMVPAVVAFANNFEVLYTAGAQNELYALIDKIVGVFASFAPAFVIVSLVSSFLSTLLNMIVMGAMGLWMRQFNVPAWGRSEDPLPQPLPETFVADPAAAQAYAYQGYGYAEQDQSYAYAQQPYAQDYAYGAQPAPAQYDYAAQPSPAQYDYAAQAPAPLPETAPLPEPQPLPETAPLLEPAPAPAPEAAPAPVAPSETAPTLALEREAVPAPVPETAEATDTKTETVPIAEVAPAADAAPVPVEDATLDMPKPAE